MRGEPYRPSSGARSEVSDAVFERVCLAIAWLLVACTAVAVVCVLTALARELLSGAAGSALSGFAGCGLFLLMAAVLAMRREGRDRRGRHPGARH